jgi:hypothetical protein
MLKHNAWHDALDLKICWRFFKYKLVLDDTLHKLKRDKALLERFMLRGQSSENPSISNCNVQPTWKLPCSLKTVIERVEALLPDINALVNPLAEINQMIQVL